VAYWERKCERCDDDGSCPYQEYDEVEECERPDWWGRQ